MSMAEDERQTMLASERATAHIRFLNFLAVTIPLLGLVAAVVLLWGRGVDELHLGLLLGMYILTGLGITVG